MNDQDILSLPEYDVVVGRCISIANESDDCSGDVAYEDEYVPRESLSVLKKNGRKVPFDMERAYKKLHFNSVYPPDPMSYFRKVYDQAMEVKIQELTYKAQRRIYLDLETDYPFMGTGTVSNDPSPAESLSVDKLMKYLQDALTPYVSHMTDPEKQSAKDSIYTGWESLREEFEDKPLRHNSYMAVMPEHAPMSVMKGETDGIMPYKANTFVDRMVKASDYDEIFKYDKDLKQVKTSFQWKPKLEVEVVRSTVDVAPRAVNYDDGLTPECYAEMERQRDAWYSDPKNSAEAMAEAEADELRASEMRTFVDTLPSVSAGMSKRFVLEHFLGLSAEEVALNEKLLVEEREMVAELVARNDKVLNTPLCKEIVFDQVHIELKPIDVIIPASQAVGRGNRKVLSSRTLYDEVNAEIDHECKLGTKFTARGRLSRDKLSSR